MQQYPTTSLTKCACFIWICIFNFTVISLQAQEMWDFPDPEINVGVYSIKDTVFMATDGNDSNSGTAADPVTSFAKAISLLPFGEPGVNGGNAYGLIMIHPGVYEVENGFQQTLSQFEKDGTYKNVSIEGIGDVSIQGRKDDLESLANGHLVHLRGSHIFIKNLKLKYAKIHGILLSSSERMTDILVENVEVDSVRSFSMLSANAEKIVVRNSTFLRGSRIFYDDLVPGTDCQWPSGLKFYDCKYIQAYNNEVAYTRGEGLNFHNSEYGLAYDNLLHDNPTNIYCDNSARIIIRNNLNYATPGNEVYWKTCPADEASYFGSTGILMANEGACDIGGPVYGNCTTNCALAGKMYKQLDSIFVFNNFFINTAPALSLWQGVTEPIGGPNCLRNIFFEHNTIIGLTGGDANVVVSAINAFFPNIYNTILGFGYAIGQNIQINGNIISLPFEDYPKARICTKTVHNLFPVPLEISFKDNLINLPNNCGGPSDVILETLPSFVDPILDSMLLTLQPCPENSDLIMQTDFNPNIQYDFDYQNRVNEMTNVGALEFMEECTVISSTEDNFEVQRTPFKLFPNPGNGEIHIRSATQFSTPIRLEIFSIRGKKVFEDEINFSSGSYHMHLSHLASGMYIFRFTSEVLRSNVRYILDVD